MEKSVILQSLTEDEAFEILTKFSPHLESLRTGRVNCRDLSKKLFEYGIVLKLVVNDQIIAFAGFYCNDNVTYTAYLSMIAVMPEYEKMGHGKKMLNYVINYAQSNGMKLLKLEVSKKNHNAIKFYEKNGFIMNQIKEDSFFMVRDLLT